jgi:hypothetical protein
MSSLLQWGNKWALQTSHINDTTTDEFDANIESVVWPAGWGPAEKVRLHAPEADCQCLAADTSSRLLC